MKVLYIEPGKHPVVKEIDGSLESMQELVKGSIQALYPYDDLVAIVCNDDGDDPTLNRVLRDEDGEIYDIIRGPFFICGLNYDNFDSLSDSFLKKYTELFDHIDRFYSIGGHIAIL